MERIYYKRKANGLLMYDTKNGDYCFQSADSIIRPQRLAPISVCWLIERDCNLDCIYCFSQSKNKLDKTDNFLQVAENILSLKPITIILTGGEPTLNIHIKEILEYIGIRALTIIDSNGTTNIWPELIPYLKNSIVRFSIDSLDSEIIKQVRPSKFFGLTSKQIPTIRKNIKLLKKHNVPIIMQTVLTSINTKELDTIYNFLLELQIHRWYISVVKYSDKCKDQFNQIGISPKELELICRKIASFPETPIKVTLSCEADAGAKSRLFVEESGDFCVDTIENGLMYVGTDSKNPSHEEVCKCLSVSRHFDLYIKRNNIISYNKEVLDYYQ